MFFLHWKKNTFQKERRCWGCQQTNAQNSWSWRPTSNNVQRQQTATMATSNNNLTDDDNDDNRQRQKKKRLNEHWAVVLCYDFSVLSALPPYLQGAIVASLYLVIFNILIHIPRSNQQRRNLVMFLNFRDVHLHLSLWFTWKRFKFQISWVI